MRVADAPELDFKLHQEIRRSITLARHAVKEGRDEAFIEQMAKAFRMGVEDGLSDISFDRSDLPPRLMDAAIQLDLDRVATFLNYLRRLLHKVRLAALWDEKNIERRVRLMGVTEFFRFFNLGKVAVASLFEVAGAFIDTIYDFYEPQDECQLVMGVFVPMAKIRSGLGTYVPPFHPNSRSTLILTMIEYETDEEMLEQFVKERHAWYPDQDLLVDAALWAGAQARFWALSEVKSHGEAENLLEAGSRI